LAILLGGRNLSASGNRMVKKLGSIVGVGDNFIQAKRRRNEKGWDGLSTFSVTENTSDGLMKRGVFVMG
jgi:hypothetical protein